MKKILAAVLALAMLLSCGIAAADGTIKVGSIGPTTGDYAQYGLAVENAIKLAVEEINALGELQFEVLGADDQGDPTQGVSAYNRLMNQGMQILLGTVTSGSCAEVAGLANEERVFMLTPSASNPAVNEGRDNVYQVCFTDPNQGATAALTIKNLNVGSKIAVIWNNAQDYSTSIYQSFKAKAAEIGLEIVADKTFSDDSNADFSVQLQAAANAGADLVFLPIYYTPVAAIMQQSASAGYNFKFFGVDGMDGLLDVTNFDTALAEGSYMLTPFDANKQDELTVDFVTSFVEKYGIVPNQFAADAYDAMYIFYNACLDNGFTAETSPEEICETMIEYMQSISFTGLTGVDMVWDETGMVSKGATAYVIHDGKYASAE